MAKWGEGDPRWVVQERSDGANVNSWHWQEVNRLAWSRQRLSELLTGLASTSGDHTCRITELKSLKGEAMLTTRKQNKRFALYDLNLVLAWAEEAGGEAGGSGGAEGGVGVGPLDGAKPVRGEVHVKEFASGGDEEDVEFSVTLDSASASSPRSQGLRAAAESLRGAIFEGLAQYAADLHGQL